MLTALNKYKSVISNFGFLSVLNILDMGLPLLVIPFITRVVGKEYFGIYSYVLVLVQNIILLTQYGFQFSATKRISQNRDDLEYVSRLSCTIIATRLTTAIGFSLIVLAFSALLFDSPGSCFMFITALGMILGDVFIPTWLFQGMERMKYVTIVNATTKGLFTLLVISFIREPEDYVYILGLFSIGFLISAAISLVLAHKQFGIRFIMPHWADIYAELRDGLALFGSTVGINLYRNLNVIILHFFVSDAAVGIYALAEKVIKACQSLILPISQALFPHVSLKIKNEGIAASLNLIKKSSLLVIGLAICACIGIWLFGDILVWLTGKDYGPALPVMTLMYPVIIFGCLNYLIGFVGLVNMGGQKQFFYSVFISGTIGILFILLTAMHLGIDAAALGMSLSEISLTVMCVWCLLKFKNK